MTDLARLLHQFSIRYRTALLAKAAVLGGLGCGVAGVLAWRLSALSAPWLLSRGVPVGLAVGVLAGMGWWVRRHWMSAQGAAAHLDGALHLKQRLITAEEFSHTAQAPTLYPLLLEDTARQYATGGIRLPKPFDHTAGILAVMALLLLLWPRLNSVLPPFARQPEPNTPPPAQRPPPDGAQGAGDATQQSGGVQPPRDNGPQSGSGAGQSPSQQSAGNQQSAVGQHSASNRQQRSAQQVAAGSRQRDRSQEGSRSADDERRSGQGQAQRQASAPQGAAGSGRGPQLAATEAGQGGQSPGDGEALKAEIQELLKEVSGELKNLQAQLASATDQPKPEAGTGTDPNLYEAPMKLEEGGGDPLSIQLHTDAAQTKSQRPGSGVGEPSGEVSHDAPRTEAQDAQLSDQPLEEAPASRQPVPAEYRSVFDRLQRRDSQPSESNP